MENAIAPASVPYRVFLQELLGTSLGSGQLPASILPSCDTVPGDLESRLNTLSFPAWNQEDVYAQP